MAKNSTGLFSQAQNSAAQKPEQEVQEQITEQNETALVSEEVVSAQQPTVEEAAPETTDQPTVQPVEEDDPFQFSSSDAPTKTESRKLDYTPQLIDFSQRRAYEIMTQLKATRPDLLSLSKKVLRDLNPNDLADLLCMYFGTTIQSDSDILIGCDAGQLDRLLESRRSDRSKAKAKNPAKNASVCRTYFSAMYAELMIRERTGKPYTGSSNGSLSDLDETDLDAISRRIKSLQSKQCRLKPLATYDEQAKKDLAEVMAEIARLNSLRPNTRTTTKTVIKDLSLDQVRAALKDVSVDDLTEDEANKFYELLKKLG